MQKSIEAEYWVIDKDGSLTETGGLTDVSELTEDEFVECIFEVKTPPCESINELRTTFTDQLHEILEQADDLEKSLVPLGTPINSESIEMNPNERGQIQKSVIGQNFDYAKYCAGTHVHFEQRNVVDQLNALIALDPALALCNSSPYFRGDCVASSARSYIYRKRCYEHFPKHGQLWDYVDTVAQWHRRLDEFMNVGTDVGISEDQIDEHFSPDDVVWTPIRLRDEMPTVEWRSPDATLPSEILRLVSDVDSFMEHLHHVNVRIDGETGIRTADEIVLPEFDSLCDYTEAAMIDGLESRNVSGYLQRMGFDVAEYDPLTTNFEPTDHVSPEEARKLRLEYAERLRRDVEQLQNAG